MKEEKCGEVVKLILQRVPFLQLGCESLCLKLSTKFPSTDIASLLLKIGAPVQLGHIKAAVVCRRKDLLDLFLSHLRTEEMLPSSLLVLAVQTRHLESLVSFLKHGLDPNDIDREAMLPLSVAVRIDLSKEQDAYSTMVPTP